LAQIFKDARKREFLNSEGSDRPLRGLIAADVLERARSYRKQRIVDQLKSAECAGILLYDPVNIRYALDVCNQQLWSLHNPFRYSLIFADGYAIDFESFGNQHLVRDIAVLDEIRPATSWFYFVSGETLKKQVALWADEIARLIRSRGLGIMLAVDKLDPLGTDALRGRGLTLVEGQKLTEHARSIKSADELELMKWTVRVAEAGMARMYECSLPGRSEQEIWAELHFENIRSGGEWIETRLLTAGQRTNPWFQECSDHVCQEGDLLSFDTDMIGPYGYCADLSRSWTIGHTAMTNSQRELYKLALEQIEHNLALLKAGVSFAEFNERSWRIPEAYIANRYPAAVHGVGMADEYPLVPTHIDFDPEYHGHFEENMVVCVESLIGQEGGREAVKLETQVVIGASGANRLDQFPWESGL
jgi:Xaa-Pro aminopeptidase